MRNKVETMVHPPAQADRKRSNALMKGVKKVRNTMTKSSSLRRMETSSSTEEDDDLKKTSNHSLPSLLDRDVSDRSEAPSIDTEETTATTRLERIMAQARGLKNRAEKEVKKRGKGSKDSNKKNKTKKRSLRRESATIYAALDMVTPKNVRCQLAEIRQEKSIVKIDIEDLIISGIETGQSEELLVDISSFLFEGGRQWQTVNFVDNVGPNDLKSWLRSKRETMDFFEDLFREQPGVLGFETLTFQGKLEGEEGSHLGNLFNLFRNIKRQRRVTKVQIFVDSEELNEGAVDEMFHLDSSLVAEDGELLETVVVLVTFGWLPDPDGLSLVDSCLRVAKDMGNNLGGMSSSMNGQLGTPALRRASTDPSSITQRATGTTSLGFKRSGTHDQQQNMGVAARREARRSVRAQRTSVLGPGLNTRASNNSHDNNNPMIRPGGPRRQTKTSQRTRRNSSRANIISAQEPSLRKARMADSKSPSRKSLGSGGRGVGSSNNKPRASGGGGLTRTRRASAPNLNMLANPRTGMSTNTNRRGSACQSESSNDLHTDGIDSSVHSSELSLSDPDLDCSDNDSFCGTDDNKKSYIDLLDDSTAQQQGEETEDEDMAGGRPALKKSLSEARGLFLRGLESELQLESEQRKPKTASRSAHIRSGLENPVATAPRRGGMERSRSACNLLLKGKAGGNQTSRVSKSSHQKRSIKGLNIDLEDTASALQTRPSQRVLARSASASNLMSTGDHDVAKSKTNATMSKSRRGRRSIRELALPTTSVPSVRRTASGSNLLGKLEWSKGGGKAKEGEDQPQSLQKAEEETTDDLSPHVTICSDHSTSISVSDLTAASGCTDSRKNAEPSNNQETVLSSEKSTTLSGAEKVPLDEAVSSFKHVSFGKNEVETSNQESKDSAIKETQAEDANKRNAETSVKRSSGNSKQKMTKSTSRGQKIVKVTKIADLPDPDQPACKAEVKKKQSQLKRRKEKAATPPSGKVRKANEQEEKVATKVAPEKRRVRRSKSDRRPSLDGEANKAAGKRKSLLRKISKDSQRAIAEREKWSAEIPVNKIGEGVNEESATDASDATDAVDPSLPPAARLQNLEKSLSESILGLMDDSSSDEEDEVDAANLESNGGEKVQADTDAKGENKENSVDEEQQEQVVSPDSAPEVIEPDVSADTKSQESEDNKDDESVGPERAQPDAKDEEEGNSVDEDEQEQEQLVSPDSSPEGIEQDVSASTNTQESGDQEDEESAGSASNSADKTGQSTKSPTCVSELAEATDTNYTPTESEESLRVKNVLSSGKRKKIDGVLSKVQARDQSSAPCAAY